MTTAHLLRSRTAALVAALSMTALLAACSASDGGSSDSASAGNSGEVASSLPDEAADSSGGDSGGAGSKAAAPGQDGAGPTTATMQRALVSTGSVSLTSKDVGTARQDVQRVVDAQGGDVTEEDTRTDDDGEASYARLVVRVPSAKFGATMTALEDVATLRSSTRGSDDVSTEVIDTGARVRAQEASLERVELLLADARDLKDVIWIESQLTSRQAELDSLKSQQAYLSDQTTLATITVDIAAQTKAAPKPQERDEPAGFLAGLRGGTGALGATATVVATIVGALLPFAVVAGVLGAPLWLVLRRRRRSAAPVPAPAEPA
ncbi:DUF4349 domain-containing protein [Nocardioides sp. J2M5]|uniref:DUF4349 domain-containing protein n=1 Tax=Nocardioides palaemonis TaxID=2829810 RepID=UPI001BAD07E2|nr:DUF4349 domain-containing protein [Nocardioides palaemonis]MBS2936655.1 DUF4349 domain-containing protein [Nocardioides palaemonis]